MNENDELEIELESPNESVDINEENYVYINVPEEVIEELENQILLRALIAETGSQIELAINSSTFVLTAKLKDKNGNLIYTSNGIDLPIESMIINGTYDEQTKKLILTLQSGNTIEISLADLISGLVNQTDLEQALQNYYTKSETYNKEETDSIIVEETKKINEVNSRIDRLYNSLPTGHASGSSIDLTDSADLPLKEFTSKGNTEQLTTTGKNLLKYTTRTTSTGSRTYTCDEKGFCSITGSTTSATTYAYNQSQEAVSLEAGTYTIKVIGMGDISDLDLNQLEPTNVVINLDSNNEAQITFDEAVTFRCGLNAKANTTYNYSYYITLASGTTATNEPYTGRTSKS